MKSSILCFTLTALIAGQCLADDVPRQDGPPPSIVQDGIEYSVKTVKVQEKYSCEFNSPSTDPCYEAPFCDAGDGAGGCGHWIQASCENAPHDNWTRSPVDAANYLADKKDSLSSCRVDSSSGVPLKTVTTDQQACVSSAMDNMKRALSDGAVLGFIRDTLNKKKIVIKLSDVSSVLGSKKTYAVGLDATQKDVLTENIVFDAKNGCSMIAASGQDGIVETLEKWGLHDVVSALTPTSPRALAQSAVEDGQDARQPDYTYGLPKMMNAYAEPEKGEGVTSAQ